MTVLHGSHDDVVWLAGLLEGEGCFDLHRGRYPRVRLSMTDRDVVGRAASLMGSTIRLSLRAAPESSTWHAEIQGDRAAAIMAELLPHMGTRRSQRIADTLGRARLYATDSRAVPGPKIGRPRGIAAPATA